ncbi:hypothetical protein CJF42_25735 [Pseudoalteromonas sp. NBT06-2]|uniref:hypothetical protein n=1 Tax=Pseudoalteromonas sp. NBT06-2 TaxID=2025950 RepID=UPI000BA6D8CC|nr:hypothetical protein [Pseudoalteromonas sp. NBT06-2]PAJ71624.1 hypothetical protein CJF42_25735 [Pseudoalteromonas sp. NBT06-2]
MKKYILLAVLLAFSGGALAYSQDTEGVSRVFVTPQGSIALQLKGGFPKAIETNQCQTNNGWAGLKTSDPVLKSVIIAAKSSGQKLTVTIEGCEGTWFKIKDLYMN